MLGVYTSGLSGAHLNPAVTFANCVFRKFPWRKFPAYACAQVLGAFCASGVVYANYKSAIDVFEGGPNIRTVPGYSVNATAGIFCTYPAEFMTTTGQFFSEFIASTLLMFLIYVLKDDGNLGAGNLTPLGLFFVIFGIGRYSHLYPRKNADMAQGLVLAGRPAMPLILLVISDLDLCLTFWDMDTTSGLPETIISGFVCFCFAIQLG